MDNASVSDQSSETTLNTHETLFQYIFHTARLPYRTAEQITWITMIHYKFRNNVSVTLTNEYDDLFSLDIKITTKAPKVVSYMHEIMMKHKKEFIYSTSEQPVEQPGVDIHKMTYFYA